MLAPNRRLDCRKIRATKNWYLIDRFGLTEIYLFLSDLHL